MKPLANPADKKKATFLGIAVGLVFLFVVKNTMNAIAGAGGTASDQPQAVPLGSGGSAPAPPTGGGPSVSMSASNNATVPLMKKEDDDLIDPPTYSLADTPSPFHKDTYNYHGSLAIKDPLDPNVMFNPPPDYKFPPTRVTTIGGGHIGQSDPPIPSVGPSKNLPITIQHDPEPPQVMGVMTGDNPVAVIRVGAQQYVVTKGSRFGHNMRLKDVTATQVVIDEGGKLHYLRVGVRPPSASPPDAGAPKQVAL